MHDPSDLPPRHGDRLLRLALVLLVYLVTASTVLHLFVERWGVGVRFVASIEGTAPKPFNHRVLSPMLVSAAADLVPERVARALTNTEGGKYLSRIDILAKEFAYDEVRAIGWSEKLPIEHFVAYGYLWLVLFLLLLTGRALLLQRGIRGPAADFAPALGLLLLPIVYVEGGYLYDFPDLLLTALALLTWCQRRHALHYLFFTLAVLNKESAALMGAWVVARWWVERNHARAAIHCGIYGVLGGAALLAGRALASGSGDVSLFDPVGHLQYFLDWRPWVQFDDIYVPGLPFVPVGVNLVIVLLLGWAVWRSLKLDREIALVLIVSLLVVTPFFVAGGATSEVRVYVLAFPALIGAATTTVLDAYRRDDAGPLRSNRLTES